MARVLLSPIGRIAAPLWLRPPTSIAPDSSVAILFFALLVGGGSSLEAQELLWSIKGEVDSGLLGTAIAGAGDLDGDGIGDVLIGAPQDHGGGLRRGVLLLCSGVDGSVLRSWNGGADQDLFGLAVASAGDRNGDGMNEVLVGAPLSDPAGTSSGAAYLFDGATGDLRFAFSGEAPLEQLGTKVTGGKDLSGDGVPDLVVAADKSDSPLLNCGRVYFFSGIDGTLIQTLFGTEEQDFLGLSLSLIEDLDGDGCAELIAGSNRDLSGRAHPGQVTIFSGLTGAVLQEYSTALDESEFGFSVSAGDLDRDGVEDIVIGAPGRTYNGRGKVYAYSGKTQQLLFEVERGSKTELGFSVLATEDLSGDGHGDVIVGSPGFHDRIHPFPEVHVLSGFDGEVLFSIKRSRGATRFGSAVGESGDLNGDGHADVVVGAPLFNGAEPYSGAAFAFSGIVQPIVTSASPTRAFYQTGGPVVITGKRFLWDLDTEVWFGEREAENLRIVDDFTIDCDAPPAESGLLVPVIVRNDGGDGVLDGVFRYTPFAQLEGEPKTGAQVRLRLLCEPGDALMVVVGAPPPLEIPTPPFDGVLCIAPFQLLFAVPSWPFDDFSFLVDLPPDPALQGMMVLCQALVGKEFGGPGKDAAWTNCLEVTIE